MWGSSCTKDEGRVPRSRPSGAGFKPLQAATVKSRGGERCRKGGLRVRQVRFRETSASEPLMTCRKVQDDVETGGNSLTRDQSGGRPDFCPDGIRHEGGVTLDQAFVWNAGTCRSDVKGETQAGGPCEGESTDAGHRGGAPVVVMKVL
jgi:hypothetical protein